HEERGSRSHPALLILPAPAPSEGSRAPLARARGWYVVLKLTRQEIASCDRGFSPSRIMRSCLRTDGRSLYYLFPHPNPTTYPCPTALTHSRSRRSASAPVNTLITRVQRCYCCRPCPTASTPIISRCPGLSLAV